MEDAIWRTIASGEAGQLSVSISESDERAVRYEVTVATPRLILTFQIARPEEIKAVGDFIDRTKGRDFDETIAVTFGSFNGQRMRLAKNASDRNDGSYFFDSCVGGVSGGKDGFYFRLDDNDIDQLEIALRQIMSTLANDATRR